MANQSTRTQTLGYPRAGGDRELKRALERYWRGESDAEELMAVFWAVTEDAWVTQRDAGVDHIGVGGETLYDHVLDWAVRFGLVAERFRQLAGLERTFAMARGLPGIAALEMTKWFDTNYHYLVPEIEAERHLLRPLMTSWRWSGGREGGGRSRGSDDPGPGDAVAARGCPRDLMRSA